MFDPTTELDVIFDTCGQDVTINGETVTVVMDDTFVLAGDEEGRQVETRQIQITCKTSDLDALATSVSHDSPVVASGINFEVIGIKPDGQGLTILELEKV